MNELAGDYDSMSRYLNSDDFKAYGYMAFLRHRGFPSPFLDWTRSRYVAGFFAFRSPVRPQSGRVAIFVYFQRPHAPKLGAIGDPEIFRLGPYVRTDRRHFPQQGQYTMCLHFSSTCLFRHHEFAFQDESQKQDTLWKLTIPWDERLKVLRLLDSHNLNALSLLESDEALLETLAFRELGTLPKSSRL
jgi:hypothetical protein